MEKIYQKVYIVSGLVKSDGNTPLADWRFLNKSMFDEYLKHMDWDEEDDYELDLTGLNIKFDHYELDNYLTTSSQLRLKDVPVTAYRITSDNKQLDRPVKLPWN